MEVQLTKQQAIEAIAYNIGKPVSERSFRRWRDALGIKTTRYYSKFDMFRMSFIASYLKDDRNMQRALISLKVTIDQMKRSA